MYLSGNAFLPFLNNERLSDPDLPAARRREAAAARAAIAGLDAMVLFLFEEDATVVPRASSWFGFVSPDGTTETPLRDSDLYIQDWLGLRALDERGGLLLKTLPGGHMELNEETLVRAIVPHLRGGGTAAESERGLVVP